LSNAGKGAGMAKGSSTRSGLLWEVERLLTETKELPTVLVMENVPQVVSEKNMKDFAQWIAFLDGFGYKSKWEILNAKDYGIPQNRERCFMVSILGDYYYEFPAKKPLKQRLKDMLEDSVDGKYYLSDKALNVVLNTSFIEPLVWDGFNQRVRAESECVGTITQKVGADLKRNGQGIIEPLERYELSDKMKAYINSYNDKYKVGDGNLVVNRDVACSKTTREGCTRADTSDYISNEFGANENIAGKDVVPYHIRKLTPKECWRLMGFTDKDVDSAVAVGMSNAQLYKQAGNSIVVQVLEAIFGQML
jgi:DNA (cytosine-5)-methyltransferase 1